MATLVKGLGGTEGFGEDSMARNDDSPSIFINLSPAFAGGLNFFGTTYTSLYLNYNGSISFGSAVTTFSPTTLTASAGVPIIAPFWGDVDIRNTKDPTPGSNLIWYDVDPTTKTFTATWDGVGYYNQHNDRTNSFQVRLVAKDEPGDFDILFYYQSIGWLTGDASGGKNGTGGNMAHAGYSSGNGKNFFEIIQSGTAAMTGLPGLGNVSGQAGVYLFEVRNGAVPLFTSAGNVVNFNNLSEEQKDSIVAGNDLYHAKGGGDTVTLPDPANYDQVVGKDKDGNDIKLNWQDTATFFIESAAGDTSSIKAGAGNHTIFASAGSDTITINGTGDNKIAIGSGSTTVDIDSGGDTIITGGTGTGTADITIDTTGSGKNTITGADGATSIKLKMVGSGDNKIEGGGGTTTIEIDSANGTGDNEIKTGDGKTDITITAGKGLNEITAGGVGDLTVTVKTTGGNDSNSIMLGVGAATIGFKGTITLPNTGFQSVTAGAGRAKVTFEGNFDHVTVVGSATPTTPAIFDVFTVKDSSSTVTLLDAATISDLHLAKDATLSLGAGANVKITSIKNGEGRPIDPGTISIGQNAKLELETPAEGKVNLGTGSSTLVLPSLSGVSYSPTSATAGDIDFHLGALKVGDSIVIKNMNVTTQQVVMADLGNLKLSDGSSQLTLQVSYKSFLSSSPTFGAYIAVDSLVGVPTLKNNVYVDVAQSANGDDTILTLKAGNDFDVVLNGPQARAQHGVTGSGIKIGIISDTFDFADPAGAARDLNSGAVPAVNVISDPGILFLFGQDEGRAMAQIIHAIAPGATLYFSSPGRLGGAGLASAINDLHAAKVDIIVDDLGVSRFSEFLSGVGSAIDSAVRSGITYVSSAGNDRGSSSIYGHSAKPNVISVAAMNVLATPSAAQPDGRYLGARTEGFSSEGTNGKPDLTGPDGGQTTFNLLSGFNAFYGTSAAAPAVAAVAGLMLQANPLLTARPQEVMDILKATALSFGESAARAGTGFVQADKAVAQARAAKDAFFNAPSNAPPPEASFTVSATPAGPQVSSAALSVPVGNAGTGFTVLLMVELSDGVIVTGAPSFTLNTGGLFTYDANLSTPSAGRLLFDYKVASGEQAGALALTGFTGTVEDASGNDVDFSALFGQPTGLTINSPLTVSTIASSKTGVVMAGETIELTIMLAHGATLAGAGSPILALSDGATATFDAASSNLAIGKLVFDYKVATGEATPSLTIGSVDLPSGTSIKDASGNHADFLLAIDQTMGVQIGPAFVAGLFPATEQTAVSPGQTMPLTLFVSQGVVVDTSKGSPTLALSNGATATYDAAASDPSKGQLVFDYKSGAGEQPTSNLAVTQVNLNGATVKDASGIAVDLTGAQNAPLALTVGSPLTVVSVQPSKTGLLNLGDSAHVTITMSAGLTLQGVNSGGPPTLTLSDGGIAFYDTMLSNPAAGSLVFDYTVMGSAHPVANLAVQQFDQNGAVLFDSKGNFADMSGALAVPLGLKVTVPDPATAIIAATAAVKVEGNGGTTAFTFTVTLDKALGASASVDWVVTGSGAEPVLAGDFAGGVLPTGTLSFAAGETVKTITVNVQGDTTIENDETFGVTLLRPSGSLVIGTAGASGTVKNDDVFVPVPTVSIAATDASKSEGNAGTTAFTFTITRGGDTSAAHSIGWSVAGSGASPASAADFAGGTLPAGTASFAAGETTKTISINVQGDTTVESSEGFAVTLANPSSGLTISTATASGTIQNDDASVSIAATSATKTEGNTGTTVFTFTVTRSGSTSAVQSVAWSVAGSSANAANAADFVGNVLPSGGVTFAVGETSKIVTINVQGDTTSEPGEAFTVTLANASAGLVIATASANGTIQNDDAGPLTAHDDAFVVLRGGNTIVVNAANGVLFNDEGSGLTASLKTAPTHGGLQLAADGSFTYTPLFGFAGVDTFAYRATSAGNSVDGEAVLFVVPVNASPTSTTLDLLALTAEQQIAATYAAFFGRAADAGGFQFWVGEFVRGLPTQGPAALFANIASSFGVSTEAQALYPFLANPFGASDTQIGAFLDSVYNNLFNRSSDVGGLNYWTGQIRQTLAGGQFVGSVLVNIMSGAQDTADGKDITSLMAKVAVSIDYVREQQEHNTQWAGASDLAAATSLLDAVTASPQSILTGIKTGETLIANHA